MSCTPWGHKKLDTTEQLTLSLLNYPETIPPTLVQSLEKLSSIKLVCDAKKAGDQCNHLGAEVDLPVVSNSEFPKGQQIKALALSVSVASSKEQINSANS